MMVPQIKLHMPTVVIVLVALTTTLCGCDGAVLAAVAIAFLAGAFYGHFDEEFRRHRIW
jgi:hypothetical protein